MVVCIMIMRIGEAIMVLTTRDALTKAALLVAAVAASNLQWTIAINPNAPALYYVGSMTTFVALTPIIAIILGALLYGVVTLAIKNRTLDHARVCFLMGLYVVALWLVSSHIMRITDIPRPEADKNGFSYWFVIYVFAFYWSWPNVRMAEAQQEIDMAAQRAGVNRWLLVGGCFVLVFVTLFVFILLGNEYRSALYWSFVIATLFAAAIGLAVFVSDALHGQMRFWKLPRSDSRIGANLRIHVGKYSRKRKHSEKSINREELKQQFITQKNWRALVRFSQEWVAAEPLSFSALYSLGLACGHLGEHGAARDSFIKALGIDRNSAEAWFNLGLAYENLTNYQQALIAYQHAVRINSNYSDAAWRIKFIHDKTKEQTHKKNRSKDTRTDGRGDYSHWYEVLGVAQNASMDEVKTAYRKLMQDYHPDKVASLGKELRDLADRKAKEITEAFREFENARQQ
jgi:tetratricopeptide (TPR) repeat protein